MEYDDIKYFYGRREVGKKLLIFGQLRSLMMIFLLWIICKPCFAQPFFYALPDGEETFNRRIARFDNNDILIGDSSDEGLFGSANGKVFLTRIDNCGNLVWSYSYERKEEYLEFKDVEIADDQSIFAYGSAYRGGEELLFLLHTSADGELSNFRLVRTGTIDHFSYSLDLQNGLVMVYGLLLDFNTQKQGFISVFDNNLQFLWGKRFAPFESEGDAIIDSDGRFICRSGVFHYALDQRGDLQWAKAMDQRLGGTPLAGPVEVPGGYAYQSYKDGASFFYKLDFFGRLVWKSRKIPSLKFAADIALTRNGDLLAIYKHSLSLKTTLAFTQLMSSTGEITDQFALDLVEAIDVQHFYQSHDSKGNITVIGNRAEREAYPIDVPYFLLQFPSTERNNDCFGISELNNSQTNDFSLIFATIDTALIDAQMVVEPTTSSTLEYAYEYDLNDLCGFNLQQEVVVIDSILECNQNWSVTLPSDDFIWLDAPQLRDRKLEIPNTYRASNRNCLEPIEYQYILLKPNCQCAVYLPTAITANGDKINDHFSIYSDCTIEEYHLKVYNRWGAKVFDGRNGKWDGNTPEGILQQGLYLVSVVYKLSDLSGNIQEGTQVGEVLLLH